MPLVCINAMPVSPRPVGVGRYAINLTRALGGLEDEFTYLVFTNSGNRSFFEGQSPRIRCMDWSGLSRWRPLRVAMEHTLFPLVAALKKVDVMHGMATMNPRFLLGASVFTLHDMTYFTMPERHLRSKAFYFKKLLPAVAKRADRIITDSNSSKEDIVRILGIQEDKVSVVYPGLEQEFLAPPPGQEKILERLGLTRPYLLFVGMLEPRKNVPMLLRAFRRLLDRKGKGLTLALAGKPGWGIEPIKAAIREEGISESVKLLGYVDIGALSALYRSALFLVYPSLYEGFGFPVLEAMACGLPVITSGVSSLPEIGGDAALYIDPASEEELTNAMEALLSDDPLRREMAQQGLERASRFTWEETAKQTAAIYREALASR